MIADVWRSIKEFPTSGDSVWLYTKCGKIAKGRYTRHGFVSQELNGHDVITHWILIPKEARPKPPVIGFDITDCPEIVKINGFDFVIESCIESISCNGNRLIRLSIMRVE